MSNTSNKPRVFVSSTIADFRDLRSALRYWLGQMGFDVQMSEYNDFEHRPDQGTFESCFCAIADCNYYVLLIGERRGSWYDDERRVSVTQQEYHTAAELAKKGKIKMLLFIRRCTATVIDERRARSASSQTPKPVEGAPTQPLSDLEFIEGFVRDIECTEVEGEGAERRKGSPWLYRFDGFDDLVAALRVNLSLHRSLRKQALLANVQWEMEENLTVLCTRKDDSRPFPITAWLRTTRKMVPVTNAMVESTTKLPHRLAGHVWWLWEFAPHPSRLRVTALQEAVASGEFLAYHTTARTLTPEPVHAGMLALLNSVQSYIDLFPLLSEQARRREQLGQAVQSKQECIEVAGYDLALLYRIDDVLADILSLSEALLCYAYCPSAGFVAPRLRPASPNVDEVARIQGETATHQDVRRWVEEGSLEEGTEP